MKEDKAVQIILFSLSGKSWGIKFEDIKEIIEVRQITPVPKTPPFISGIINHRGNILTIIDLALFAEQSPGNEKGYFKIFHLKSNKMNLGLLIKSDIAMEPLSAKIVRSGSPLKKALNDGEFIIGKKVGLKNKTEINLLDGDKIIEILDVIQFN